MVNAWDQFGENDPSPQKQRRKPHWTSKALGAILIVGLTIINGVHHDWIVFGVGVALILLVGFGAVHLHLNRRHESS